MPLISYIKKKFSSDTLEIIDSANTVIQEYLNAGEMLTVRQLYYQFVARGFIKNNLKEYKRFSKIISNARLAGLIDWASIEDRTRFLRSQYYVSDVKDAINDTVNSYRLNKWSNQRVRPEVWIEKEALLGVIEGVCDELDVDYFACKGNPSQSSMWQAAQRLQNYIEREGQRPVIIYLGDHDPTGIDITRDIEDRLSLFLGESFSVSRIALTYEQIQYYNPPPNPVKLTDTRSDSYVEKFGTECWELDALEPRVIKRLIRNEIEMYIDPDLLQEILDREEQDISILKSIRDKY